MKRKCSNVSRISIVARNAWQKLTDAGVIDEPFDAWRRRICQEQFGCRLSEAPKKLHDDIEAHFLSLVGETGKAFDRLTGPDNELRTIAHEITVTARTLDLSDAYIAGICRRMFQVNTWTTAKQAKSVLIALKAKLKKSQHQTLSA